MPSPALENVQWIAVWGRQEQAVARSPAERRKIGGVGIVGAGLMGTAIAAAHVRYRLPVAIHDADEATLGRAGDAIAGQLRNSDAHLAPSTLRRLLRPTSDLADIARCDLVIEAIPETLPAKLQLYAQLQRHLGHQTIVASNTSTIPLDRLAQALADPSRFCGMHFCHPVAQRPLVEIIHGPRTSDRTLAAVVAHAQRIDRIPLTTPDGPGFVVNRLLFPYLGEALELLQEGETAESIEAAAVEFGMALGPLRMMDEIGLDTTLRAGLVLAAAFPERIVASPLLVSLIKAGRLGRKSGAGFFAYDGENEDNPSFNTETPHHCNGRDSGRRTHSLNTTLAYRLMLPMLLEATRLLEEGMVRDPREIDLAVLFGLGFPAEKGGLLWWADTLGADRIIALLGSMAALGLRAEPTPLLKGLAKTGGRFYQGC
jgi:3-hydroxyacyl-CoA dehydrogenase/enoyl-CoA hydratase/3-hydroxybutyryl-CoA epimerase/3-hydroxyacyl-CoA dehydrogenase/enoyl-CoA hydratase/3-hydroxybutyryl-CoA epimerase/enoyl-CoA isomerase